MYTIPHKEILEVLHKDFSSFFLKKIGNEKATLKLVFQLNIYYLMCYI